MAAGGCGRTSALDGHPKVGAGWGELDECGASGIDRANASEPQSESLVLATVG